MCKQVIWIAAALLLAPFGAKGADLVVWWEEGYYAQEYKGVRETIAAFEQQTGERVDLLQPTDNRFDLLLEGPFRLRGRDGTRDRL